MHSLNQSLLFFLIILLSGSCSTTDTFSGFSYDPEGATVTTDKEIQSQHRRTIGISGDGIWLTNEFPGARMSDFYKVNDTLYQVVIEPENHPVNNSPWYAFKIWSDSARTVDLKLTYHHGEHRYWPDLSADGHEWTPMEAEAYETDTLNGTATLSLDLSPDTLWVSAQELVTVDDYRQWLGRIQQKPYVELDTVGYSHRGRPLAKITIGEVPPGQKRGVLVITGRLHPPEVTGALAAEIFIDELASETKLARRFRSRFEILAYPLANPDGVENGHWRHNAAGVDLNRDWIAFNQPESRAIRDDLLNSLEGDSLRKVYYGVDFHSTDEHIFYPINREIKTFPEEFSYEWMDSLLARYPDTEIAVEPFDTSSPIVKNWIYRTFGADAITYEVFDRADRAKLEELTRSSAQIIMRRLIDRFKQAQQTGTH